MIVADDLADNGSLLQACLPKDIGMESLIRVSIVSVLLFVICASGAEEIRSWTLLDGSTFEASFRALMGKTAVMENSEGKQVKIHLDQFSKESREHIELKNPPQFKVDFRKKSKLRQVSNRFGESSLANMPVVNYFTFGTRIAQRSAGAYNHEMKVEFFAIGAQRRHNNKYILLDHQTGSFIPSDENNRSYEFWSSRRVELEEYAVAGGPTRGKKYDTYLIILTDKNGEVIEVKSEKNWPLENLENLRKLSVGSFMDTTCTRVYPGRPKPLLY